MSMKSFWRSMVADDLYFVMRYEISAAMRRNTQDNVESYLPQVSDFYGFQWELKERAKRICGDRIL